MKFELLSGRHSNKHGNFKAGDIIDANSDLEKQFVQKFKRRFDLEQVRVEPVASGKKVVPTKVVNVAQPKKDEEPPAGEEGEGAESTEAKADEEASQFGTDVTADFPSAVKAKLKVYKTDKNKFNLVDPTEPNDTINATPCKDAAALEKVIAKVTG